MSIRPSSAFVACSLAAALTAAAPPALPAPRVASINLCTDQLVLNLADDDQILSVSWLSAHAEESMLAEEARRYPLNYGTAEEMLRFAPDVVLAGAFTTAYTQMLLRRLGYRVVAIEPAQSLEDVVRNLRIVGRAIGQLQRAESVIEAMLAKAAAIALDKPDEPVPMVLIRPGGFTASRPSLADDLLSLAGYRNIAVDAGLDKWGSLSMESVMMLQPELIVVSDYRSSERSLANAFLEHPALRTARRSAPMAYLPTRFLACGLPQSLDSIDVIEQSSLKRAGDAGLAGQ